MVNLDEIAKYLDSIARRADYWSLRLVERDDETLSIRRGVIEPNPLGHDQGVMITVVQAGSFGYGATSRLDQQGIQAAFDQALSWAEALQGKVVAPFELASLKPQHGVYLSPVEKSWESVSLNDRFDLLRQAAGRLKSDDRIVDWMAAFHQTRLSTAFRCSLGSQLDQEIHWFRPWLSVTAHDRGETERRSFGGYGPCRQGGLEVLDQVGFWQGLDEVPAEALQLLKAPNCPTEEMDLLLAPDQMILQIHESIGHPLELDRILGDERNYAGRSFVSPDMFGTYQYGSDLLNVTFDPTVSGECASYAFDDEGSHAEKVYLIKNGLLLAGLGGRLSQVRSGLPGVANSRAVGWNRPPIDRMANLNLEPGHNSFDDMVSSIDRGIYMRTNSSWSIDDSRNKFQFGCEWAQLIEKGKLTKVVRKPNYRGISSNFWRSLSQVGDLASFEVMGTPYCGKGEPNQAIEVGHASPPCVFRGIQVFGGEG